MTYEPEDVNWRVRVGNAPIWLAADGTTKDGTAARTWPAYFSAAKAARKARITFGCDTRIELARSNNTNCAENKLVTLKGG